MSEQLYLYRMTYRIGRKDVMLSVSSKNRLDVWSDNWSEPSLDLTKPLDDAEAAAAIRWAIKDATQRDATPAELELVLVGVVMFFNFFNQANGAK